MSLEEGSSARGAEALRYYKRMVLGQLDGLVDVSEVVDLMLDLAAYCDEANVNMSALMHSTLELRNVWKQQKSQLCESSTSPTFEGGTGQEFLPIASTPSTTTVMQMDTSERRSSEPSSP